MTEDDIEVILAKMNLDEKVAQLAGILPVHLLGRRSLDRRKLRVRIGQGIGFISAGPMPGSDEPGAVVRLLNAIQRYLVEETRSGIPAIAMTEALSGLQHAQAANFPTPIAVAAAWSPDLVERAGTIAGRQARAIGFHQAFAPVLDIARDARWGRVHETYGEDSYLSAATGAAYVRGLQGSDLKHGVAATGKHFLGYALSEAGRHYAGASVPEQELRDMIAYPFEAAIRLAKLQSVMTSYAEINGEPPSASVSLLTDLLRDQLGFDGFVVSDYGAIESLVTRQRVATTLAEAGVRSLAAGLDVELPEATARGPHIVDAVRSGRISETVIDRSVRRVLEAKFRLGLFDNPYVNPDAWRDAFDPSEPRRLAFELAARSLVLLKNDDLLPLPKSIPSIAVIGPNADSVRNLFGWYTAAAEAEMVYAVRQMRGRGEFEMGTDLFEAWAAVTTTAPAQTEALVRDLYPTTPTILDAIRARVTQETVVRYSLGCGVNDPSTAGIQDAVELARGCEVAILVLGDKAGTVYDATTGEGRDRSSLDLPGAQSELVRAIVNTGTPVAVVLVNGRPMPVPFVESIGAIIEAWLPGAVGGEAVAAALFGEVNPSGRLPITIPRSAGQCPIYYNHRAGSGYSIGPASMYSNEANTPAYPFGHGLSYTKFELRSLRIVPREVSTVGEVAISACLTNIGTLQGEEVVQLYLAGPLARVTRPVKQLAGFARVSLAPGESRKVIFHLRATQLAYTNEAMEFVVEPGDVEIMVGSSSADLPVRGSFHLVGPARRLTRRDQYSSQAEIR